MSAQLDRPTIAELSLMDLHALNVRVHTEDALTRHYVLTGDPVRAHEHAREANRCDRAAREAVWRMGQTTTTEGTS